MPKIYTIGVKSFTLSETKLFSRFSKDYNPVHRDSYEAKLSFFGAPIVHGILVLLWALEILNSKLSETIFDLSVEFRKPIYLNSKVFLTTSHQSNEYYIKNSYNDILVSLKLHYRNIKLLKSDVKISSVYKLIQKKFIACSYGLNNLMFIKRSFPNLLNMYGIKIIDEICNISKIVGMQVPGRYSILSQVKLSFKKNNKKQNFIIRNVDNRLKRYILEFNGKHIKAEIIAYARPEPILSRSYVEVTAKVTKLASVQSKVALVIGGSRGLGELTTKILCAQGLRVFFSYDSGYEKARQIQNEISAGSGDSEIFKFNIDSDNLSNIPHEEYYEVYYFATPRIVKNFRQDFNFELFGEYQKFYVLGFQRIFRHLCNSSSVKFFYPSTTLIDEPQKGYREYISAKIEGENMINNIVLKQDTAKILVARLPGLLTDQNNDLLKGNVKDPWQSVNQFVQKMHKFN